MRARLLLILLLLIPACKANPYATVPDGELHAKAKQLALPERYALSVEVLHSRIPPRPILAGDVAALGPSAWTYVFAQATSGGFAELSQALPVLSAFKRRCSTQEIAQLRAHADHVSAADTASALKGAIDSLCGADLPAGD